MASTVVRGLSGVSDGWQKLEGKYLPSKYDGKDNHSVKVFLLGEKDSGTDGVAHGLREFYQFSPEKQMELNDGEIDLHAYKKLVRQSAVESMILAVTQVLAEGFTFVNPDRGSDADKATACNARLVKADVPKSIWMSLERIWQDEGFRDAITPNRPGLLSHRDIIRARYYFQNVSRIGSNSFIPTIHDVSMCRRELNGVVETPLRKNMWLLEMPPLQSKSQTKQVAQFVSYNTVVVYCIDMSTFDLRVDDFSEKYRLVQSFEFFKTLNASPCLRGIPVFVILTNKNGLEQKLNDGKLLADSFPKYKGKNDAKSASHYLVDLFGSVVDKHRFSALVLPCKRLDSYQDMKNVKRGIHDCVLDIRSRETAFPIK